MNQFLNKITSGDCIELIPMLEDDSIDLFLSDIPYGISLDEWDVLHNNTNSALLGTSPAQAGSKAFKRRGKPINGWSSADRKISAEYQQWCSRWTRLLFPKMKKGASLFVFGARRTIHRAITAFEESGFAFKDILAWQKTSAYHRAQRTTCVLERRGLVEEAEKWKGWRLGNLAPIWEPIAWFFKPYDVTITDNLLENELGAINIDACQINGKSPTNLLKFALSEGERRIHEAQKPVELLEYLIKLTTIENQIVLDPFIGSGSTAIACQNLDRKFIGFEINQNFVSGAKARICENTAGLKKKQLALF